MQPYSCEVLHRTVGLTMQSRITVVGHVCNMAKGNCAVWEVHDCIGAHKCLIAPRPPGLVWIVWPVNKLWALSTHYKGKLKFEYTRLYEPVWEPVLFLLCFHCHVYIMHNVLKPNTEKKLSFLALQRCSAPKPAQMDKTLCVWIDREQCQFRVYT